MIRRIHTQIHSMCSRAAAAAAAAADDDDDDNDVKTVATAVLHCKRRKSQSHKRTEQTARNDRNGQQQQQQQKKCHRRWWPWRMIAIFIHKTPFLARTRWTGSKQADRRWPGEEEEGSEKYSWDSTNVVFQIIAE